MRAPFLSLEELNTSSAEELAATIAGADAEHQRLEAEDKVESQELAQLEEHIDNAQVAAGAIGETAERLEATYPKGVPDEVVQTLEPVLEALKNVVGFKPGSMKVAVEGLSGKERTRVAVEGLKETANKIWEAIKAAWKRMVDFFKSVFTRQGRQRAAVEKKIDATVEAIEKEIEALGNQTNNTGKKPVEEILYPKSCLLPGGKPATLNEMMQWIGGDAEHLLDAYKHVHKSLYELHDLCATRFFSIKDIDGLRSVENQLIEWSKKDTAGILALTHNGVIKSSIGGFQGKFTNSVKNISDGVKDTFGIEFHQDDQDVTGSDASTGPVILREDAKDLLERLEKLHKQWPTDDDLEKNSKLIDLLYKGMVEKVTRMELAHREEREIANFLKDIMMRLFAYGKFLNWVYRTVMVTMMGMATVCASSTFSHDMDAKFGK